MIKVSRMADYAVLLVCKMAREKDVIHSAHELSINTSLSITTISKILTKLTKAEITKSVRGVSGGYKLLKDAKEISVGNIIDIIDGKVALTVCIEENNNDCGLASMCSSYSNWQIINNAVTDALNAVSIKEMAFPIQNLKEQKLNIMFNKITTMEN